MRPVPWFWVIRVALSVAAAVAWGAADPRAPVWQLALVCMIASISLEGLRWAYRDEQGRVLRKRPGRPGGKPPVP